MSQDEVLSFLENHKGVWFNSTEIAKGLNVGKPQVSSALKKLRKTDFIVFKIVKRRGRYQSKFIYKCGEV